MSWYRSRALQTAVLMGRSKSYVQQLLGEFGASDFVVLNGTQGDDTFPNLLPSGGLTLSFNSGSMSTTLQPDGSPYIAGGSEVEIPFTSFNANDKTFVFVIVPDTEDLSTNRHYILRIDTDTGVDEIRIFYSTLADRISFHYIGGGTNEPIEVDGLVAGTRYVCVYRVRSATDNVEATINGATAGTPQAIATDWVSSTPNDSTTVIGNIAEGGGEILSGLFSPIWIFDRVLTNTEVQRVTDILS